MILFRVSLFISLLVSSSLAQTTPSGISFNFTTIDSSECVSPPNYLTCYEEAVAETTQCIQEGPNNDAYQNGCYCLDFVRKMNCFATSCWNRIYGCEYQVFVAEYIKTCDIAAPPYPYWPAPANAPGGCSCNLADIVLTVVPAELQTLACYEKTIGSPSALTQMKECDCCFSSVALSTLIDVCPATDPSLIGQTLIFSFDNAVKVPWTSCGPVLDGVDCVGSLGFVPPLSTGSLYGPTNTPPPGTQTLSDIPGQATSPGSGATFSWTQLGSEFTIIADKAEAVATTSAVVVAGSSKGGATATAGSGTAAAGSAATGSAGAGSSGAGSSGAGSSGDAGTTAGSSANPSSGSVKGAASRRDFNVWIPIGVTLMSGLLAAL